MLRISGALAGIALVAATLAPSVAVFTPLVLYTLWTNGPHSPVMNGAYEPILLVYGQLLPPLLVGAVATGSTVFVEWINYHLYARARDTQLGLRLSQYRWVARLTRRYARWPFAVIVFCALGPVPFWVVRILSVLTGYSPIRHLVAVAVGRFPRLWIIAAMGQPLGIPTPWLIAFAAACLLVALGGWGAARWRRSRTLGRGTTSKEQPNTDARGPTSDTLYTHSRVPANVR